MDVGKDELDNGHRPEIIGPQRQASALHVVVTTKETETIGYTTDNRQFYSSVKEACANSGNGNGAGILKSLFSRGVRQQARLAWGKFRRMYYCRFEPGYVDRNHKRRRGQCLRCGACCRLMIRCPLLVENGSVAGSPSTECSHHGDRHDNCRVFPIDEADLADRNIIMPDQACGYYFVDDNGDGRSAP